MSDDMLVRYLLREATEAEQLEVQEWVLQSRENKDHLDRLRLLWTQSTGLAATSTVNTNEAWQRFAARTQRGQPAPARRMPLGWMKAAAAMLLLAGVGTALWYYSGSPAKEQAVVRHTTPVVQPVAPAQQTSAPEVATAPVQQPSVSPTQATAEHMQQRVVTTTYVPQPRKRTATAVGRAEGSDDRTKRVLDYYRSKEFVCNGTPCPLEICIIQTISCPGCKPSAVATCSTLLPDQSGQLRYKEPEHIEQNCSVTVQEIRIRRVNTGETIVLDEHSKPATAEELFNYITGRKKGNILAGIFHTDCDNDDDEHDLKLENNFGNLILQ
jgi:hypothetical protein